MKLYVTFTSPYARLARIVVLEKGLQDRVEVIAAQTRVASSPYYRINPSGRVPYLIDDAGVGMEDSRLICAYLDSLDGKPRLHRPASDRDWAYSRVEARARSLCDGIAVWVREMSRPASERSPTTLAHEAARAVDGIRERLLRADHEIGGADDRARGRTEREHERIAGLRRCRTLVGFVRARAASAR